MRKRTKTPSFEPGPQGLGTTAEPGAENAPGSAVPSVPASQTERRAHIRIRSPHNETFFEAFTDFVRRVYKKADQDQIFFMAGSISFNILVAVIPLLLAALGIAGQILERTILDPEAVLLGYIVNAIPEVSADFEERTARIIRDMLDQSSGFTIVGLLLLAWVSTRLVGTLRSALREVFDVGQDRGIIMGKLFDLKMVLFAGTLLTLNVALTFAAEVLRGLAHRYLNVRPLSWFESMYVEAVALVSAWIMFLLIYRYLPYRRIQWRTAITAATFTTVLFELLKRAFAFYAANLASYASTYGVLANLILFFLWIYWMAVIFILGGEVGQVAMLRHIRRKQKERLG